MTCHVIAYFVKRLAVRHGRNIAGIDDMAKAVRLRPTSGQATSENSKIPWNGSPIVLKRDEGMITVSELPQHLSGIEPGGGEVGLGGGELPEDGLDLKSVLEEIESKHILRSPEARCSGQQDEGRRLS